MQGTKEELLIELYLVLSNSGPGQYNHHNLEWMDPTFDAVELYSRINNILYNRKDGTSDE